MSRRRNAIVYASLAILAGLTWRLVFVTSQGFDGADLERFEAQPYGVDLPDAYRDVPFLLAWTRGDGQAYVALAADPWAQGPAGTMTPALYRYARAGYAWAGRLFGLGMNALIPVGLLAVNLTSLGVLGWVAGWNRDEWGLRALLLVAVPGALIATASDTAEAFGLALATIALLSSTSGGIVASGVLGLVRPDFATVLFLRRGAVIPAVAATAGGALGIRLLGRWGLGLDWAVSDGTISPPLVGYLEVWAGQSTGARIVTLLLLMAGSLTVGWGVARERGWRRIGFVLSGLFLLMFAPKVLQYPVNSLRAAAGLWVLWALPAFRDAAADTEQSLAS